MQQAYLCKVLRTCLTYVVGRLHVFFSLGTLNLDGGLREFWKSIESHRDNFASIRRVLKQVSRL